MVFHETSFSCLVLFFHCYNVLFFVACVEHAIGQKRNESEWTDNCQIKIDTYIEYTSCGRKLDVMNVEMGITFNFAPFSFVSARITHFRFFFHPQHYDCCQHANLYLCPFSCLFDFYNTLPCSPLKWRGTSPKHTYTVFTKGSHRFWNVSSGNN